MKKRVHLQLQWISYVTQTGRLMHVMMTKIHPVGKVYHFRAKRQMAESLGQVAKFKRLLSKVKMKTTMRSDLLFEQVERILAFRFQHLGGNNKEAYDDI